MVVDVVVGFAVSQSTHVSYIVKGIVIAADGTVESVINQHTPL